MPATGSLLVPVRAVPATPPRSASGESALGEARGLVFVGRTANELEFRGLRLNRYPPPCR